MKVGTTELAVYEALAERASKGDRDACHELVAQLWPAWVEQVSNSRRMGSLTRTDDHVHNVVSRLVDKFERGHGKALRQYVEWRQRHPAKTFDDWIRIVTANVERDYVRERLGSRASAGDEPSQKRLLNEFSLSGALEALSVRPPMTMAQTARELLEFARSRLSPQQGKALERWLEGTSFEDLDRELRVPAGEGRKLLRAAVATLRRHFGALGAEPPSP